MKVYSLSINDETVVQIEVEVPRWLPVRPVLNRRWLRGVVASALREYFQQQHDTCPSLLTATMRS